MYLQITTKCNMTCAHCCYSCGKHGQHMDIDTWKQALRFVTEWDTESVSIGGGEPTMHPEFIQILQDCLDNFYYVWFATNGSNTQLMHRLAYLLDNGYDELGLIDYECHCDPQDIEDGYECECWQEAEVITLDHECQLSVALSLDRFHDPIDETIESMWRGRANRRRSGYEVRDVTSARGGIISQGRAVETGVGRNKDDCVCSDVVIKPDGTVRLCGCEDSPVIGNVWSGIEDRWQEVMYEDEGYLDTNCYKGLGTVLDGIKFDELEGVA